MEIIRPREKSKIVVTRDKLDSITKENWFSIQILNISNEIIGYKFYKRGSNAPLFGGTMPVDLIDEDVLKEVGFY